ncbi:MAG: glycosyltransferase [Smithella sp.]
MKICMITKFPPIQGGISAAAYWLAKGLAEAGVEVHVVTNSLAIETEYRISGYDLERNLPEGVTVHQVDSATPWHLPFSPLYEAKLLDKSLEVCNRYHIDILDSRYLIPYGIVAFLAGRITSLPYIIRHGGSDLDKFWYKGELYSLLKLTFSNAAAVVSERPEIRGLNPGGVNLPRYIPDERFFYPLPKENKQPNLAYVGKINYYWQHKGLEQIIEFWKPYSSMSRLVFLAGGTGKADFMRKCQVEGIEFADFIPPWEMPAFLRRIDYLFCLVKNNPIPDVSNIVLEAVSSGVKILTDDVDLFGIYQSLFPVSDHVIDLDSFTFSDTTECGLPGVLKSDFRTYVALNINLYKKLLS